MSVEALKKRRNIMFAVNAVAMTLAVAAFVSAALLDQPALYVAGAVGLVIGFGAQIWFMVGVAKAGKAQ